MLLGNAAATFTCSGQRQLLCAVLTAPAGTRVLGVLPPGMGKTVAVLAAVWQACEKSRDVVIVTPLIALSLDMERRLQEFLSLLKSRSRLKFCSGKPDYQKSMVEI